MYIVDDICYAGNSTEDIRVIEAKPLMGGMLLVTFNTGEKRLFDTTELTGGAFAELRNEDVFNDIKLFHGIITWKDGEIDIAPETVYADSYPYDACDGIVV